MPTEQERELIAARLQREVVRRFGTKKAAYIAAGVNSATMENALTGRSMKDHTLRDVVLGVWPETEGDWRRIPGLYDGFDVRQAVVDSDINDEVKAYILRVLDDSLPPNDAPQDGHTDIA